MTRKRQNLILICLGIFFVGMLTTVFREDDIFPFVKYDMFNKALTTSFYEADHVFFVYESGIEKAAIASRDFLPYLQNGLHKMSAALTPEERQEFLNSLLSRIKKRKNGIQGVRMYGMSCNCDDFRFADKKIEDFFLNDCKKVLKAEAF